MPGFDIKTLLQFQPPQHHCEKCFALFKRDTLPGKQSTDKEPPKCPVCNVQYIPAHFDRWQVDTYLASYGYEIKVPDLVPHTRQLARIAADMNSGQYTGEFPLFEPYDYSAIQALLEAISRAQAFTTLHQWESAACFWVLYWWPRKELMSVERNASSETDCH